MPSTEPSGTSYRFGLFEANSRTGELRKQGRLIKLRGRPFDILILLLERRADLISREELRQKLWAADTFVDFDHGLNSAVNRLREALGDSAESPRFIETLPKRGYRFIAPVEVVAQRAGGQSPGREESLPRDVPEVPPPSQSDSAAPLSMSPVAGLAPTPQRRAARDLWLAAAALLSAAAIAAVVYMKPASVSRPTISKLTLAVLPFQNLSDEPSQEFFSDGFTEEMIAELGKLDPDHLGVIARTTTMLYKNAKKTIGQIRQELGVDYVLEGSIRRAGDRVRITAQLIQASDMTHLWAESYDRDVSDVLAIQSEVAMKIANSLALALKRSGSEGFASSRAGFPAYELVLRGRFFRQQATEEGARKAIEYFTRAIELEPGYAAAHSGLADCYRLLGAPGWEVEPPGDLLKKGKAGAERALALDPESSEARAVLSMVKLDYDWDRVNAEREILEAIRLNPNSVQAHQYYSALLTTMGRLDDAIREARRALELDPLSATAGTTLAIRYWYAGRIEEARGQFVKTLEVNPGFAVAHWGLAQCYRTQGDTAKELEELRRATELSGNSAYMRAHLAYGLANAGQRDAALAIQRELEVEGRERYVSPYHFALIAAGLGDIDAMMVWLERAFTDRSGWMMFMPVEPEFERVRNVPAFRALLGRVSPRS